MLTKLNWLKELNRKELFFLSLLVLTGAWTGILCDRVSTEYLRLFVPFSQALKSAAWVIGSLLAISIVTGIVSTLLRPVRALSFGHLLGALALILVWHNGWMTLASAALYLLGMNWYSRTLAGELEKRMVFSLRPLSYEQRKIFITMAILLSFSFTWGYRLSAQNQLSIPDSFKSAAEQMILSGLEAQVQNQPDFDASARQLYLDQARRALDETWTRAENAVQPYVKFIPLGLILPLYLLLMGLLDSLGWISFFIMWILLSLLTRLGVAQTVSEPGERKSLRL